MGEVLLHPPSDTASRELQGGIKRFSFLPEVTQEVEECTGEGREAWVGVSGERLRGGMVR